MKKFYILFFLACALFIAPAVHADVIPPNSHYVDRCVKIVNLTDFPDVVLVGYYTGPMVQQGEAYQIKNDECLTKGYKFNALKIYYTTQENFKSLDLKNLNTANLSELILDTDVAGTTVADSNPLIKETLEYSLTKSSNGKYDLYKTQQLSEYNDGTPSSTKTFGKPLVSASFWRSFVCFFVKLFGGNCGN